MKQLKAKKIRTLVNGITVWQISTSSGKIIQDDSYRGSEETEENVIAEFWAFLKTKACNSDINISSYYKNALNN